VKSSVEECFPLRPGLFKQVNCIYLHTRYLRMCKYSDYANESVIGEFILQVDVPTSEFHDKLFFKIKLLNDRHYIPYRLNTSALKIHIDLSEFSASYAYV